MFLERIPSNYRSLILFGGIFAIALFVQTTFQAPVGVGDLSYWSNDAAHIAAGQSLSPLSPTYVHPGTTILYPAAALIYAGVDKYMAVRAVMVLYIALCVAFAGLLAFKLMPQRLWWVAVAVTLMLDIRFLEATPPSGLATLLSILIFLLLWIAYQNRHSIQPLAYLGVCIGLLLATRIDTGAFLFALSLPILSVRFGWRTLILIAAATLTLLLCNPFLYTPLSYVQNVAAQAMYFRGTQNSISLMFFYAYAFSLFSILLSLLWTALQYRDQRAGDAGMPSAIYVWLLSATVLSTALLLLFSSFHPIRYFLPFYAAWDILLPYWIFAIAFHYRERFFSNMPRSRLELCVLLVTIALVPVRILLLIFNNDNVL